MVINTHLIIKVCKIEESYKRFCKKHILEIDDFNVIVEVVHLCGGKHRLISSPFANEKKKAATNVVKFIRTYVCCRKDE
jgi:hypothetical protein